MLTTAEHNTNAFETDETDSATSTIFGNTLRNFFSWGANAMLSVAQAGKDGIAETDVLPAVSLHTNRNQNVNTTTTTTTTTTYCKQQQTTHNTYRFFVALSVTPKISEVKQ